jgi:dTMP kinase
MDTNLERKSTEIDIINLFRELNLIRANFPGKMITVSGMDGTGKTTSVEIITDILNKNGQNVVITRQPSKIVRNWEAFRSVLSKDDDPLFERSLTGGLVTWDRLNTQLTEVIPALSSGKTVICERYVCDICVFGLHRGAKPSWITHWVAPLLMPDCNFITDAPIECVMKRLELRGNITKRDEINPETVNKLLRLYREAARTYQCEIIDTSQPIEVMKQRIYEYLLKMKILKK